MQRQTVSGILLAGGQSRRMGRDKASLPWRGSDILNTQLDELADICDELIVASNAARDIRRGNVRAVPDNYPGCGPLAGLEAGLSAATHAVCFVAACDMPFINVDSVLFLIESAEGYDAAIPRIDGRWHPLYAVYRKACVAQAREMLSKGCYRMTDLLAGLKIKTISADELEQFSSGLKMLANLNMPEEWQKLQRMPGLNCVNTSSVKGL